MQEKNVKSERGSGEARGVPVNQRCMENMKRNEKLGGCRDRKVVKVGRDGRKPAGNINPGRGLFGHIHVMPSFE